MFQIFVKAHFSSTFKHFRILHLHSSSQEANFRSFSPIPEPKDFWMNKGTMSFVSWVWVTACFQNDRAGQQIFGSHFSNSASPPSIGPQGALTVIVGIWDRWFLEQRLLQFTSPYARNQRQEFIRQINRRDAVAKEIFSQSKEVERILKHILSHLFIGKLSSC